MRLVASIDTGCPRLELARLIMVSLSLFMGMVWASASGSFCLLLHSTPWTGVALPQLHIFSVMDNELSSLVFGF